jgi:RNA polymerase-associated protein RTF1
MPELEREDVLAARRDEITKRKQRVELAAMVRKQQDAGKKKPKESRPKPRKLKRASAPKKTKKKKADSDDEGEDDFAEADEDDSDAKDSEQDDEESDYERTSTRRGHRSRKPTGASTKKDASLSKLKKRRNKAEKRRKGQDTDDDTSDDDSSEYDAEAQDILNRKAKERDRRERDPAHPKREIKASREEERIALKKEYSVPELEIINDARLRRDHFMRMIHRPDWTSQLVGKFARVNMQLPGEGGRLQQVYRLVQITNVTQREHYYEVADQCTNVYCTLTYGEDKMEKMALSTISNSPVTEDEYSRWRGRIERLSEHRKERLVPSKEATLDIKEDLEAFISRPFTDQDINDVIKIKRQAREAFMSQRKPQQPRKEQPGAAQSQARAGYDEVLMGQMNEKHRKADRERIAEAERRNAALQKKALNGAVVASTTPALAVPGENGSTVKVAPSVTSLSLAAASIDVDLGDF